MNNFDREAILIVHTKHLVKKKPFLASPTGLISKNCDSCGTVIRPIKDENRGIYELRCNNCNVIEAQKEIIEVDGLPYLIDEVSEWEKDLVKNMSKNLRIFHFGGELGWNGPPTIKWVIDSNLMIKMHYPYPLGHYANNNFNDITNISINELSERK